MSAVFVLFDVSECSIFFFCGVCANMNVEFSESVNWEISIFMYSDVQEMQREVIDFFF